MKKIALITGASSGIGESCARRLLSEGWKIVALARRADRLNLLSREFPKQVYPLTFDLLELSKIATIPSLLPEDFREVELLINNAGLALGVSKAQDSSLSDWMTMVQTNISSLLALTHAVLPGMIERNRGHIINLGSIAGTYPYPGGNVYGATKAFVQQFTLNLKADLLGTPIRITNIEPGMVETEFSLVRFLGDQEKADSVYHGMIPLTGEDIAECVSWCAHLPAHVNINTIELMPTHQAFSAFAVNRTSK